MVNISKFILFLDEEGEIFNMTSEYKSLSNKNSNYNSKVVPYHQEQQQYNPGLKETKKKLTNLEAQNQQQHNQPLIQAQSNTFTATEYKEHKENKEPIDFKEVGNSNAIEKISKNIDENYNKTQSIIDNYDKIYEKIKKNKINSNLDKPQNYEIYERKLHHQNLENKENESTSTSVIIKENKTSSNSNTNANAIDDFDFNLEDIKNKCNVELQYDYLKVEKSLRNNNNIEEKYKEEDDFWEKSKTCNKM